MQNLSICTLMQMPRECSVQVESTSSSFKLLNEATKLENQKSEASCILNEGMLRP